MPELVHDCPRCKSNKITFDVTQGHYVGARHGWVSHFETFCVCRNCRGSTIFVLSLTDYEKKDSFRSVKDLLEPRGALNRWFKVEPYVVVKGSIDVVVPEHVPEQIAIVFQEAALCRQVGCFNASATMFRLCLDLITRAMLPQGPTPGLNYRTRRDLGLRLPWLFDNHVLPESLRDLSTAVKEDGNDGAHSGNVTFEDVDDLLDFTTALLERIYTEPKKIELARARRDARRAPAST